MRPRCAISPSRNSGLLVAALLLQLPGCLRVVGVGWEDGGELPDSSGDLDSGPVDSGPQGGTNNLYAGYFEFADCRSNHSACPYPLTCVDELSGDMGSVCEFTCQQLDDCPNPGTFCSDGVCRIDACGPQNGTPNGPCTVPDAGTGTCLPFDTVDVIRGDVLGYNCTRPGSATDSCVWPQAFSTPETTCPNGQVCSARGLQARARGSTGTLIASDFFVGSCKDLCDTTQGGCSNGTKCTTDPALYAHYGPQPDGYCADGKGNGCAIGLANSEYQFCKVESDCPCGQHCTAEQYLGNMPVICQARCQNTSECPRGGEYCDGGLCQLNYCGILPTGAIGPGKLNGPCSTDPTAGDDGICVPSFYGDGRQGGGFSFGICYRSGTATDVCDPAMGQDPAGLCAPGTWCFLGHCTTLCDPAATTGSTGCGPNVACAQYNYNHRAGACFGTCLPSGSYCVNAGDCCSLRCGAAGTCA